mgnify:CR=1 FL=1
MKAPIILGVILFPLSVAGQPVLDRHVFPVTGTIFGYHDVPYQPAGNSGMGLKWDYSALPMGTIVPYEWTTTAIAPGAGAFPSNALVLKVPGEPTAYYQPGDTALHWLGTYTDTALVRFDPPLDILDLPCGMYTTWRDSGIAAITGSGALAHPPQGGEEDDPAGDGAGDDRGDRRVVDPAVDGGEHEPRHEQRADDPARRPHAERAPGGDSGRAGPGSGEGGVGHVATLPVTRRRVGRPTAQTATAWYIGAAASTATCLRSRTCQP